MMMKEYSYFYEFLSMLAALAALTSYIFKRYLEVKKINLQQLKEEYQKLYRRYLLATKERGHSLAGYNIKCVRDEQGKYVYMTSDYEQLLLHKVGREFDTTRGKTFKDLYKVGLPNYNRISTRIHDLRLELPNKFLSVPNVDVLGNNYKYLIVIEMLEKNEEGMLYSMQFFPEVKELSSDNPIDDKTFAGGYI